VCGENQYEDGFVNRANYFVSVMSPGTTSRGAIQYFNLARSSAPTTALATAASCEALLLRTVGLSAPA
jgi:hypothetical protein